MPLSVSWSQEQYTKIFSSVVLGASFTYPSEMQQITAWFLKMVEATLTCEQIIDCIQNDPDTALAIQQFLAENGYGTGSGTPDEPTIYNQNPLLIDGNAIAGCDNDMLFGAISQLVILMNSTLTDIFEQIEVQTNYIERTQLLLSGIPLVGLLPIDEFIDFADQIISALAENYAAQYNQAIADEYRCDLFCIVKDTCELDFQVFADYFMSRVGQTITQDNINAAIEWFVTGVWTGSQVVHASHALICQFLAYGSQFCNLDMAWLGRAVTSALNDPDPDWQTLCEDCPPDLFEPAIAQECTVAVETMGIIDGQQSPGVWRISSQHYVAANGESATISDISGRTFRITNAVKVSGTDIFSWTTANAACATTNGFGLGFLGLDIKTIIVNTQNAQIWTYDFTVVLV